MLGASQRSVIVKTRSVRITGVMGPSLKIFILFLTAVAFADNENIAEPRNGMLGIYFNPNDPVSRLAALWWSRLFEKNSNVKPAPKPTAPAAGSQPPEGQNDVQTTTGKPPLQMVQVVWPPLAGVMPHPGGGQNPYYPNIMQLIPYPQPSQQGHPMFVNMQGQPLFMPGQQNPGGGPQAQQNIPPGFPSSQVNQVLHPLPGQGQVPGLPAAHPQPPQLPSGTNHDTDTTQYPVPPGTNYIPGQQFQTQQFNPSGPNLQPRPQQFPNGQQLSIPNGQQLLVPNGQQLPVPNGQQLPVPNGQQLPVPNGQQLPVPNGQQFPNGQQLPVQNGQQFPNAQPIRPLLPQPPVPGQQQQPPFQLPRGSVPFPSPNQVFQVRAPDGREWTVISTENVVIDGQPDVTNATNGIILNSGTVISDIHEGAKAMQAIPLHSMLLAFPFSSNSSGINADEPVLPESVDSSNITVT